MDPSADTRKNPIHPGLVQSGQPAFEIRRFFRADSPADFERALGLRLEVFVEEQQVPLEEERDDYDDEAMHWLLLDGATGEAVATGRMVPYQEACQMRPVAKIGRVAVGSAHRGQRLGERLMRVILESVRAEGYDQAILDSQAQVLRFYEKLGFVSEGDEFMDAGIPHYRMRMVF